jgi:hypothetical protein
MNRPDSQITPPETASELTRIWYEAMRQYYQQTKQRVKDYRDLDAVLEDVKSQEKGFKLFRDPGTGLDRLCETIKGYFPVIQKVAGVLNFMVTAASTVTTPCYRQI